jgi:steroid delta-isomerase-like uncharacterized protein
MNDDRSVGHGPATIGDLSRRAVLQRLGASGFVAAVGLTLGGGLTRAQGTPTSSPTPLPSPVADWVAAWKATDADQLATFYAEDAVYEDVLGGVIVQGRAAIHQFFTAYLGAFSDASSQWSDIFGAGDRAAAQWTFSGNYTGQYPGLPPGTGQPLKFRGAEILELRGGKIVHDTAYVDYLAALRGIGVLPPAATPAAGIATPIS